MVKVSGRRAVIACAQDPHPKRRDQRTDPVSRHAQTITQFFHSVAVDIDCSLKDSEQIIDLNRTPIFVDADVVVSPSTPHRIELCQDNDSHDQVVPVAKNPPAPRGRRKLKNGQDVVNRQVNSHKLTEYFPVRRSVRKTKKIVLEEKQRSLEEALRCGREDGLEIQNFERKGRGVVASRSFCKGDFVVEYSGELIDITEAKRREQKYAQDQSTGCYMYYFKHKSQQYCVDATAESGRLGRLVNHSRNGNLLTRTVLVDDKPRLVLIAKDDIEEGEEISYDYGDRSKESLKHHPWLAL